MTPDADLIARYAASGAPEEFAELVRRYGDLVYASALRQVGDRSLADDVTQATFVMFARKAGHLRRGVVLAAWLMNATWYASRNALRAQRRRRRHETEFAMTIGEATRDAHGEEVETAENLSRCLDRALGSLKYVDRCAVVLHYLQGRSFADVAHELNTSAEGARKRIERAVAKLRDRFAEMGVEVPLAAVGPALAHAAARRAPESLLAWISQAGGSGAAAAPMAIASGAIAAMRVAKIKWIALVALVIGLGWGGGLLVVKSGNEPSGPAKLARGGVSPAATSQASTQPSPMLTPSRDDPIGVLSGFAEAVRSGDGDRAKTYAALIDPSQQGLLDQAAQTIRLVAQFKATYRKTFGDAAGDALPPIFGPTTVPSDARVEMKDDRATVWIGTWPFPLVRVGQTWKLPSSSTSIWVFPITSIANRGVILTTAQATDLARRHNLALSAVIGQMTRGDFTVGVPTHRVPLGTRPSSRPDRGDEAMAALQGRLIAAYDAAMANHAAKK